MKKYILVLISLPFIIACTHKKANDDILSQIPDKKHIEDSLSAVALPDSCEIGRPLAMVSFGNYVVIAQDRSDYMLTILDLSTGNIQHLLQKGHGENEVLDIHQMIVRDTSSFYVYDIFSRKLLLVSQNASKSFELKGKEVIDDYFSITTDSSLLIGCCVETDHRYQIYNKANKEKKWIGTYKDFDVEPNAGRIILQGNMLINNSQKRFAWMSYYGIAYQIASYEGQGTILHTQIFKLPQYHMDALGEQTIFEKETTIGFTSITNDDKRIFALFSGQLLENALKEKEKVTMGKHVIELDWDGIPKHCWITEKYIKLIAYNPNIHRLFLLIDEDNGYRLKSIRL